MDRIGKHNLAVLLLYIGLAFLPFGIASGIIAHGLFSNFAGSAALIIHPYSLVVVGLFMLAITGGIEFLHKDHWLVLICITAIAIGAVIGSTYGEFLPGILWRYIWFGIISILVGYFVISLPQKEQAAIIFVLGFCLWSVVAIVLYIIGAKTILENYPWDAFILSMRMPGEHFLQTVRYDDFMGNMNKVANGCVLTLVLAVWLWCRNAIRTSSMILLYIPISLLLIITFSRGAFIILVCIATGIIVVYAYSIKEGWPSKRGIIFIIMIFLIPVLASVSTERLRDHWQSTATLLKRADDAKVALSKSNDDAKVALSKSNDDSYLEWLFGIGPGAYGVRSDKRPESSTHNLYLDVWKDAGLLGLGAFITLLVVPLTKGWKAFIARGLNMEQTCALAGLASIAVLGLREYALSYLFVTALGGFFLGVFGRLGFDVVTPISGWTYENKKPSEA